MSRFLWLSLIFCVAISLIWWPGAKNEASIFELIERERYWQLEHLGFDLVDSIDSGLQSIQSILLTSPIPAGGDSTLAYSVGETDHELQAATHRIAQQPYSNLGNLLDELGGVGHWTNWEAKQDSTSERSLQIKSLLKRNPEKLIHNAGPASNYEDEKKFNLIRSHDHISLFLNMQVVDVRKADNRIVAVIGKDIQTGKEYLFEGNLFSDCTGDGTVGFLAGADYRMGRESKSETGEPRAPEKADQLVMGTSVQWYTEETEEEVVFPDCPWAVEFNEETCIPITRGDWDWEAGLDRNQITEIEYIRDYALRAVYGNWSYLKNHSKDKEQYANKKLAWVAYIGGKRESRRLLGDVILKTLFMIGGITVFPKNCFCDI